ncbi:hypothetical protein ALC56_14872, partial [Trachymyrmex septentrionalis]
ARRHSALGGGPLSLRITLDRSMAECRYAERTAGRAWASFLNILMRMSRADDDDDDVFGTLTRPSRYLATSPTLYLTKFENPGEALSLSSA